MEAFLFFSSFKSLLTYLNIIFVGVIIFFAINKFTYIMNVVIYSIAKTFIPMITLVTLGKLLGTSVGVGIGSILILLILYFILGLFVIKILEKIVDYFNTDTILHFIFSFIIGLFI